MINSKRIVCWTPYGRESTYSILINYLRREVERGIVDEVWAYMNTDPFGQESDIAYAEQLNEKYDWFHLKYLPDGVERHPGPKQRNTGYAYRYMTDANTVYIRLDDDIVYLHKDAISNLVEKRLEMPYAVGIFGTTWNNAIVSWYAQQQGLISRDWGECGYFCMDPVGWANGAFAVKIHELLLSKAEADRVEDLFLYQDFPIKPGTQFSVSCFASLGSMYRELPAGPGVLVPDEEEHWHTVHQPKVLEHPNILAGNALVSHYTFTPQRPHVYATGILARYRSLSLQ